MRKFILSLIVLFYVFGASPTNSSAQLEDGTYSLNYQVNKVGDISASIANDYFGKPAKLFVENGKMRVQLTVKQSGWITEFAGAHGGNKKVSENTGANTRLVEFIVTGINSPTVVKMKVDIDEMNYHHTYSTDFVWDANSLTLLEAAKKAEPVKEEPKPVEKAPEPVKEEPKAEAVEPKPAPVAQAPAPVKVEEKPVEPVKTEAKVIEETKKEEPKPVEAAQEPAVEKATEATEEKTTEPKPAEVVTEEVAEQKVEAPVTTKAAENEEDKAAEQKETVTLTEETEKAEAPAEATQSSSKAWIYLVIALIAVGGGAVFMRKRSSNKTA